MKRNGYTLIEVMTVVAVFSVAMLIATNIFLIATRAQRETAASQKTQGDIRFAMESIVRSARFGTVDYDCYMDASCTPDGAPSFEENGQTGVLAVIDSEGVRVRFRTKFDAVRGNTLQQCSINLSSESLAKCQQDVAWDDITPSGVVLSKAVFFVKPLVNPFVVCTDCVGTTHLSDVQPRVTILLLTRESGAGAGSQPVQASAQTTVTTRSYGR